MRAEIPRPRGMSVSIPQKVFPAAGADSQTSLSTRCVASSDHTDCPAPARRTPSCYPHAARSQLSLPPAASTGDFTFDDTRFERLHNARPQERPTEQGGIETPGQPTGRNTPVEVNTRMGSGSARARLPDGEWRSRPQIARTVQQWHTEKAKLGKEDIDVKNRDDILYQLADICTTIMRQQRGVVGDVARSVGGGFAAPPIDPTQIESFFGDLKRLRGHRRAYHDSHHQGPGARGSNQSRAGPRFTVRQSPQRQRVFTSDMAKRRRTTRKKCLVIRKSVAPKILHLRVSPLGTVGTHEVRIINDSSSRCGTVKKREDFTDTQIPASFPRVCVQTLYPSSSRS